MERRESTSFLCKKWGLFSFSLIGIVVTIVVAALASKIIDNYVDNNYTLNTNSGPYSYGYTKTDLDNIKTVAKVIIYIVAGFSVLFQSVGLVGAYKEHYCMTMTYAIMMTLAGLGSIANAVRVPTLWLSTVLYFIICVIAYAFLYDLRQIRRAQFAGHVIVTNPMPTMHIQVPGPSVVYNSPQYNQQYGQQYQPNQQYSSHQQPDQWQQAPPPFLNENKSELH